MFSPPGCDMGGTEGGGRKEKHPDFEKKKNGGVSGGCCCKREHQILIAITFEIMPVGHLL